MNGMKTALMMSLALTVVTTLTACEREGRAVNKAGPTVLVLIDYQEDFLGAGGRMPIAQNQVEPMLKATNAMIAAARGRLVPIIYTMDQYNPFEFVGNVSRHYAAMRFEGGSSLDPRIDNYAGVYFTKVDPSAFSNSAVQSQLAGLDCGHLVLAGVHADSSIIATAKDALARGYQVTVISDAVGAASDAKRDAALQQLRSAGARIESSADFVASLGTASAENRS
jgi:nicotinamidase-related amidase